MNNTEQNQTFSWPVRVYYEDTDAGGVVYYANYLRFMERARTEWLRALGFEQDMLRDEHGVVFAVRHAEVDYLKPALFNDSLEVTSKIVDLRRASFTFEQSIVRHDSDKPTELCRGRVRVVCVDMDGFRPCALPDFVKTEIQGVC